MPCTSRASRHVLSISGYHMAVVAGVVFFFMRAALALIPASRRATRSRNGRRSRRSSRDLLPLLSGAEVATQRSYLMTAIVLVGVLADRPALTLRTLSLSALAVLLLAPEAVVHPSFQMSFAATLALIALYGHGLPWLRRHHTSLGARVALWGGREIVGLMLASLVAGLATTPYAAFHFHRLAPYGVLANLAAMPVVSAWVMPTGMVALLAMPFGFDGVLAADGVAASTGWTPWRSGWRAFPARWAAWRPSAGSAAARTAAARRCLLRTPLRWAGMALLLIATVWAVRTPQPDIYVAGDGRSFAVRTAGAASRCCAPDRTASPPRTGSPPMPIPAPARSANCARRSPATTPAARCVSPTAASSPSRSRPRPSRKPPPRRRRAQPPHRATRLRYDGGGPQRLAPARRHDAAAHRHGLRGERRPAGG